MPSISQSKRKYLTSPPESSGVPRGIPHILANDGAERFSYYGMRAILVPFLMAHLCNSASQLAPMTPTQAKSVYHLFMSATYFFPFFGAILADAYWGKYRTILYLSLVYCVGHACLALNGTTAGVAIGLSLIAVGAGGIKPCVTAHIGDQFGPSNKQLFPRCTSWFYWITNFGGGLSMVCTPYILEHFGTHAAFGLPGILMLLAAIVFWAGRYRFVHVPPQGFRAAIDDLRNPAVRRRLLQLLTMYMFAMIFFSLYDQTGSAWVLQAGSMDCHLVGVEWLPAQIQAINPVLVLLLIPLHNHVIYPAIEKGVRLTPMRKIGAGLLLIAVPFAICGILQSQIDAGLRPNIVYHVLCFVLISMAEVLFMITLIEVSYTQAPQSMKSIVMSILLLSVAAGNALTALVNTLIERNLRVLDGQAYYWFFAAAAFSAACIFGVLARRWAHQQMNPA